MTFEMEVLLGACGFVANKCDNLKLLIPNKNV